MWYSTPQERALGKIVKEKFGTDFFMMDRYPMAARPFYTMPSADDPVRCAVVCAVVCASRRC